jgi:hypothetical protein
MDPETGEVVRLFNPRLDQWAEHFELRDIRITGLTATGRATVSLLRMNDARRLELRRAHAPL